MFLSQVMPGQGKNRALQLPHLEIEALEASLSLIHLHLYIYINTPADRGETQVT